MPLAEAIVPLSIQVHPADNVAIIVNKDGLSAGTRLRSGLVLVEEVPEAHKVALIEIPDGAPVVRYGEIIGYARETLPAGSWVHEERMVQPDAPSLDAVPLATAIP